MILVSIREEVENTVINRSFFTVESIEVIAALPFAGSSLNLDKFYDSVV